MDTSVLLCPGACTAVLKRPCDAVSAFYYYFQDEVEKLMKDHIVNHKFSIKYVYMDDKVYIRLSANVYNTREDYHKLCRFICDQME